MYHLIMDWYNKFECIGKDCTMTCCTTAWNILVDEKTYETYQKLDTEFGKQIVEKIDPERRVFISDTDDKRCPMLDGEGLCEIIKQMGPGYLCNTCKIYPRQMRGYGAIQEWSVDLTCPAVAEYLFSEEKIGFSYCEKEDEEEKTKPYDYTRYQAQSQARTFCVELLQERQDLPLIGRLYIIRQIHEAVRQLHEADDITMDAVNRRMLAFENPSYQEEIARQIENLHRNPQIQYRAVFDILEKLTKTGKGKMVQETLLRCRNSLRDEETFIRMSEGFYAWCKRYERAYENYFVYHMFLNFIDLEEPGSCFESVALEFLFIQLNAMEAWNMQELTRERYRDIIAGTARKFEHGFHMQKEITELLREYRINGNAYVLFWLLL